MDVEEKHTTAIIVNYIRFEGRKEHEDDTEVFGGVMLRWLRPKSLEGSKYRCLLDTQVSESRKHLEI